MSERLTSFLIFAGGVLAVLALWYLSVLFVRHDTRRRAVSDLQRRAWIAAAAALPLIGFALYLFVHLLSSYLKVPPEEPGEERITAVKSRPVDWRPPEIAEIPDTAGGTIGGAEAAALAVNAAAPGTASGAETGELPGYGSQHDATNPAQPPGTQTEVAPHLPLHAGSARRRFQFVVSQGPYAGQQFDFQRLPLRLGRGDEVNIALDDDLNVSRSHAELYAANGALRIRDLGSMHGTQVNGVPVSDQVIQPGDRISVGGTTLILRELP